MSANVRNAVGLTVTGALSLLAVACDEPAAKCNIARGMFAAKYTLVSSTGTSDCASLPGDMIQVDVYYQPTSTKDRQPNLDHASAAFQPSALTGAINRAGISLPDAISDLDPNDKPYAYGAFAETYPKDGFCTIPTLSVAHTKLAAAPEMYDDMCMYTPPQDAVDVTYTFGNIKVYVTPEANGTQFAADLTYAIPGQCSAVYKVVGLSPYVTCGVDTTATPAPATGDLPDGGIVDATVQGMDSGADIDGSVDAEDGGLALEPDGACVPPDPGTPSAPQVPDDTACSSVDDPKKGLKPSGISPEFATVCDPVLLTCVPSGEPPSLKP